MARRTFCAVRGLALGLCLLVTAVAAGAPGAGAQPAPLAGATVPLTTQSDHLYVDVRLDGSAPLHFALDTSGGEIVDAAVAERLHLRLHGHIVLHGVGDQGEPARLTQVGRVELGAAKLDDVTFVVLPLGSSFGQAEGVHIDGIIGPELLARFTVTVDAAGGSLTLAPPGSGPLGELPLTLDRAGHPRAPCTVGGLAARCGLDTGSRLAVSLLRPFLDAHPALAARATTAEGVNGFGIGGPARGRLGPVEVGLGAHQRAVVGDYTAQRSGAFASRALDANLGEALLRRFVVTYDTARGRARVTPSAAFDEPQALDHAGLFLVRAADGGTAVIDVRPGTPAASAGVRAGDVLVALDGTPAAALSLERGAVAAARAGRHAGAAACARPRRRARGRPDPGRLRARRPLRRRRVPGRRHSGRQGAGGTSGRALHPLVYSALSRGLR